MPGRHPRRAGRVTLSLLGYENVRNYDGSFGEWGNRDDTPIIT